MIRFTTFALLLHLLVACLGCGNGAKQNVAIVNKAQPPKAERTDVEPLEPIEIATPISQEPEETPTDPVELNPPIRILLMAKGGPLLLDVSLSVDGRPYGQAIDDLIDRVLSAGDTDADGRSTWSEWSENEEFLQGDLANVTDNQARRVRDWVKRYDENNDDLIQRAEAAAWLGRDSGQAVSALRLRSSRSYSTITSPPSRLWQLLDSNSDAALPEEELQQATERIMLLDTNDDRILSASELASLRDQLSAQIPQRTAMGSYGTKYAAMLMQSSADIESADYLLGDLYAPRQRLVPKSFPNRAKLFATLDSDADETLRRDELEQLLTISPHAKFVLKFNNIAEQNPSTVELELLDHSDEVDHVLHPTNTSAVLITKDSRCVVTAHDLSLGMGEEQSPQRNQIGLMVHDQADSLFQTLDINADGQLGEREILFAIKEIRRHDADSNQHITRDELLYPMTVAFLRSEAPGEQSFYIPSLASPVIQTSTTASWFHSADLNADGDVSRVEFLGTAEQFDALDTNNDDFISAAEADTVHTSR